MYVVVVSVEMNRRHYCGEMWVRAERFEKDAKISWLLCDRPGVALIRGEWIC